MLEGHKGYGIGEFTVGALRSLGLDVLREPDGPGHVVVTPYPTKASAASSPTSAESGCSLGGRRKRNECVISILAPTSLSLTVRVP